MMRRGSIIRLGVVAAAFAALTRVVAPNDPFSWETDVVDLATRVPDVVGIPARAVMQLGIRAAIPCVAVLLYLVVRRVAALVATLIAGVTVSVTNSELKQLASRPRPSGVRLREHLDTFGYPSGHAALAFALAAVAAAFLPGRWRWVPFGLATTVGFARMHVGVHFPLDVIGGALWGLTIGWIVLAVVGPIEQRLRRPSADEDSVDQGPLRRDH